MFVESAIFNLEQILRSDFTIRFCTLCSNFAIADFEELDSCWFVKSQLHFWNKVHVQIQQMNSEKQKQNLFKTNKAQQAF